MNTMFQRLTYYSCKDISPDAMLFIGGHCEDDVKQGGIGNCWFVASVACFALHEKLVKKVRMLLLEGCYLCYYTGY